MTWFTNPFARRPSPPQKYPSARPVLEALEDRDVPSYVAAEFPGHGVWRYDSSTTKWQQLTTNNASQAAADSNGNVVAEFPGQGVWLCNPLYAEWEQLTANNASSIAIASNSGGISIFMESHQVYVVAEFPGQGLWLYEKDFGTSEDFRHPGPYQYARWSLLTSNNAATEAVDANGHVVAEFAGYGVWLYDGSANGWNQLTPADATSLAIAAVPNSLQGYYYSGGGPSIVAADFPGYGVWRMRDGGGWVQLTASEATNVGINGSGDVVGEFPGWGVWSFTDSAAAAAAGWHAGWNQLTAADAALVGIDAGGHVYGEFPGWGVWFDHTYSWQCLSPSNASSFGVGG